MSRGREAIVAAVAVLALAGVLALLHGPVLGYPFIADDFHFLHETEAGGLEAIFGGQGVQRNYYRPIGRELYFWTVSRVAGEDPGVFHAVNFGLLVLTLAGILWLGRRLADLRTGILAAAAYALVYPHRVLLSWVSCAQDLLATGFGVGAALAFAYRRPWLSAGLYFVALFCKESVAPLPLVFAAVAAWEARRGPASARVSPLHAALRRSAPHGIAAAAWLATVLLVRTLGGAWNRWNQGLAVADVQLTPAALWEGFRGTALSVLYLDQPWEHLAAATAWLEPPWAAMALAAAVGALAFRAGRRESGPGRPLVWGGIWFLLCALPLALVGHHFSAYYVSFAAVGFALAAGTVLARVPWAAAAAALAVFAGLNTWANATDVYREREDRPGVSHFTAARMERAARFLRALRDELGEHPPPPGARVHLSHVPVHVGFAPAENRALWVWFDDPGLELSFVSRYRPETGERPAVLLRFDADESRFVTLPPELAGGMVAGEDALAAGEPGRAVAALSRALAAAVPGRHDLERIELGNSLGVAAWAAGDTGRARSAWRGVLAIAPGHEGALLNLTSAAASAGRWQEARRWVDRLLGTSPGHAVGLLYRARLHAAVGETEEAARHWSRLRALHPAFVDSLARAGVRP